MWDGKYVITSLRSRDEERRQTGKKRTKKVCSENLNNLFIINKNSHASVYLKNLRQKMAVFTIKSKHLKIISPWGNVLNVWTFMFFLFFVFFIKEKIFLYAILSE